MKFCDKLPKLRKDNNYSQEQLAERLNVSRQAVSKWEMGSSYPDMDKMLQMCKILNCNLDDLMDDGVLGENVTSAKSNKFNINMYMKDFLNFITRSYNMFVSMTFKEKIKFIFEMTCICVVLLCIGAIICSLLQWFILNITRYTAIGWAIISVIMPIFITVITIIGVIIALHLYKIRYLDYFVTIEDQNVTERTIEEPIEKKENKYYQEKPKEKIIIRDAKHSTFSFFDLFGKIILVILKVFAIMFAIPTLAAFVFFVGCIIMGIYHIQYGALFLWIAMLFLGLNVLSYVAIEWLYNFVMARKQHLKRLFILGISGLILVGSGAGLAIATYLSYDIVKGFEQGEYSKKTITLPVTDNIIFHGRNYEYIIDDAVSDIRIEIECVGNIADIYTYSFNYYGYEEYYIQYNPSYLNMYKSVLNDLKNNKARDYDTANYMRVTCTMSKETQDKLNDNYSKLEEKITEINKQQYYRNYYDDYFDY